MAQRFISIDTLTDILRKHRAWLEGDDNGRADLRYADLRYANLRYANLRGAYLCGADLRGAKIEKLIVYKMAVFTGLYYYDACPIIAQDKSEHIKLGCYLRSVDEWAANFWNNPSEFPNNGDTKSKQRWLAYQTCLQWLEVHREDAVWRNS